jgi:hypothetical protein
MKFNWFKKKNEVSSDSLEKLREMFFEEELTDNEFDWMEEGPKMNGLPVIVADDDFFEYLVEEGHGESIEYDELILVYEEWAAENVE